MLVLGISPAHDASIALIRDGQLELFLKEERLSRKKRDKFPFLSLLKVKEYLGSEKLDYCVLGSPTPGDFVQVEVFCEKLFNIKVETLCHQHHLQHTALAFYNSGFEESLVFVIDRNGSLISDMRESESVYYAKYPCSFFELYKTFWAYNPSQKYINYLSKKNPTGEYFCSSSYNVTKVYESATSSIHQHPLENGKTMGLAAHGEDSKYPNFFSGFIPKDRYFTHKQTEFSENDKCVVLKGFDKDFSKEDYKEHADLAHQVQKQTQEVVLKLIKKFVDKTQVKNVCITGGYGLNVVSNSYYKEQLPDVNFFFEPLADDSGNSIGVALLKYRSLTNDSIPKPIGTTFFHGFEYPIDGEETSIDDVVNYLIEGKSVATFFKKAEGGPRSLGHRSILFDPRNKDARDIVNLIKKREWYRPFAVACLEEDATSLFDMVDKSPYMTMSFRSTDLAKELIPGVLHVDGSCRIQTVDEENVLYPLLKKFKEKTGVGALLNTSFNLAGEPLVETPEDAKITFTNSTLDCVWFPEEDKLWIKK